MKLRPLVSTLVMAIALVVTIGLVQQRQIFQKKAAPLITNTTLSYIHQDQLGSTALVTDANGSVVSRKAYYPYGSIKSSEGQSPTERGYTGQVSDADQTGLLYYNARYYDPTIAKFTQADKAADTLNKYAYVGNNPIINTDPSGNMTQPPMHDFEGFDSGGGAGTNPNSGLSPNGHSRPANRGTSGFSNDPFTAPQYSAWQNLAFGGSPCSGCHVTHDGYGDDWGIPDNSELDPNLVAYYRSLDSLAKLVHSTAFASLMNMVFYTQSLDDYITLYKGIKNLDESLPIQPGGLSTTPNGQYGSGSGITNNDLRTILRHVLLSETSTSGYSSWSTRLDVAQVYAGPSGQVVVIEVSVYDPRLINVGRDLGIISQNTMKPVSLFSNPTQRVYSELLDNAEDVGQIFLIYRNAKRVISINEYLMLGPVTNYFVY